MMAFKNIRNFCIAIFYWLLQTHVLFAQENEQLILQGKKYLDLNIRSLDKYSKRLERTQTQVLKKLKKKEERLAARLKRTDSASYARLQSENFSFDSILQLSRHPDSATFAAKAKKGGQKSIDSLKGIYQFIQGKVGDLANKNDYTQKLDDLKGRLAYDQYINELTQQHTKNLEGLSGGKHGIKDIQKELFYAKAKISEWKKLADEPSKAEEIALEYLQGTKGFDGAMKNALNSGQGNSMAGANSAEELQRMGIMTKRMMNDALKQKFGDNLSAIQGNMGKQVGDWQEKATSLQSQVKETNHNLNSFRNTAKPAFKVNPMRGRPLFQRIEKQYSFNTFRANALSDGSRRPAILSLAGSAAYRHRPGLSTGLGIAGDLGLGQSWSAIRLSFEGIGLRGFINWELIYRIGLYGGYEITFKQDLIGKPNDAVSNSFEKSIHSNRHYSEAVMFGCTKKYKINAKLNGQIQVLYDAFWRDKGLRNPLIIRFVNTK